MKCMDNMNNELRFCNVELKRAQKQLKNKYNSLASEHETALLKMYKLNKKYEKQHKRFGYKGWDAKDIVYWIVNLDRTRYQKYRIKLEQTMMNECIDGECLKDLDKKELFHLGIHLFKDRRDIYNSIHELIKNDNGYNEEKTECLVCMDAIRSYACVPCGHYCVCDSCKEKVGHSCPVCQTKTISFLKIYS
eukprot:388411_1